MIGGGAYRRDIDGLRAIAVLAVLMSHAGVPGFAGGYVGVDVFFVISGFLITGILLEARRDGRWWVIAFYERRVRRILPALLFVTAATLAVAAFAFPPAMVGDTASAATAAVLFAANLRYWWNGGDYFASTGGLDPMLHTWSLGVEEQFYLLFPLFLWLVMARFPGGVRLSLAAACAASLALCAWLTRGDPVAAFHLLPSRGWELGLGGLLAAGAVPPPQGRPAAEAAAAAGLAAIGAAVLLYGASTPFPGLAALLPCLGTAFLVWAGNGAPRALLSRLVGSRPLVFVGLLSYSIYLWHWPLLVFARNRFGPDLDAATLVALLGLTLVLSWLTWRLIEQPWRRLPPAGPRPRIVWTSAAGAVGALALAALLVGRSGGVPAMAAPELYAIDTAADLEHVAACAGRAPSDLCTIGVPGRDDVLLWGDSHAGAVLPGVDAALRAAGLGGRAAVATACPPLLGVRRRSDGRADCAQINEGVIAMLGRSDRFPTVILAGRWPLSVEGTRPAGEEGAGVALDDVSRAGARRTGNAAVFAAGIERTLAALRASGRKTIILGATPEIGWSVPHRMALARIHGSALPEAPSPGAVAARHARAEAILRTAAAQASAIYLDLTPLLCRPRCAVAVGGIPLYADDDHLSRSGAIRIIAPALRPFLKAPDRP